MVIKLPLSRHVFQFGDKESFVYEQAQFTLKIDLTDLFIFTDEAKFAVTGPYLSKVVVFGLSKTLIILLTQEVNINKKLIHGVDCFRLDHFSIFHKRKFKSARVFTVLETFILLILNS